MMPTMLQNLELEDRRTTPAMVKITPTHPSSIPSGGRGLAHKDGPEQSKTEPQCLWCGRAFTPRATGGSPQRFCSTGHRQAFWIAARRWIMRAVQVGLLSADSLKVP